MKLIISFLVLVTLSSTMQKEVDRTREIRIEEYDDSEWCLEGEEFHACGSECPEACYNLGLPRACGLRCKEGCFCREGLVRHHDGHCVAPQDCPKDIY